MKINIPTYHQFVRFSLMLILSSGISCSTMRAQSTTINSIHLSHENDVLKLKNATDRYYSFGVSTTFQHALPENSVLFLPTALFKDTSNKYLWGINVSIKGYTPGNLSDITRKSNDRPFAGTLTLTPYVVSVTENRFVKLSFETGVRGPAAHSGDLQNWVHRIIGDDFVEGWENQLDNKLLLNLYLDYAKPLDISRRFEIIPESSVGLGNHKTYLQQGVKFRIGIFNHISNTTAYATNLGEEYRKEIFATFSAYGRISFVDATWSNEQVLREALPRIDINNLLGGYQAYVHVFFSQVGVSLGYNKVTPGSDMNVKHSYGTLTVRYRW